MEKEINIADILQDKPKGTTLYSPAFGYVVLSCIYGDNEKFCIEVLDKEYNYYKFTEFGKLSMTGECMLFPAEKMCDWEKFIWKKGDVLVDKFGKHCIFKSFSSLYYTQFASLRTDGSEEQITSEWTKEVDENAAKHYISEIERAKGGKLNLETLKIEHIAHGQDASLSCFQPFQQVLVRNSKNETWLPRHYAYRCGVYNVCTDSHEYYYCIPYNEETKYLLGTTKGGK